MAAAISGKVTGVSQVLANFKKLETKAMRDSQSAVGVGFGGEEAFYALYVHENIQAHHPIGQAKFLEQPMRTMRRQMTEMIARYLKAGKPMEQALFYAGNALLQAAIALCPIKTGALRRSGFVKVGPK